MTRAGRWDEAVDLARSSVERQRSGLGTVYRDAAAARLLGARGEFATAAHAPGGGRAAGERPDRRRPRRVRRSWSSPRSPSTRATPDRASAAVKTGFGHLESSDDTVMVGPLALDRRPCRGRARRARSGIASTGRHRGGPARRRDGPLVRRGPLVERARRRRVHRPPCARPSTPKPAGWPSAPIRRPGPPPRTPGPPSRCRPPRPTPGSAPPRHT